ncbi:hypothetical protein GDO78_022106 [Eleutherodactylus coqui]|uniref:Uncharacterized protein n=1 Tax=Eleutherodactylus coqui TaxID=57060 RepID=A0A8J6EGV3_ELECQ|nr:hypothetical protein GDO78_022106 [Eleutherodactylus coqui]
MVKVIKVIKNTSIFIFPACEPEPVQCQAPPKCPSPQVCVPEPVCEPKAPPQVICSQSNQKQDMGVKK